MAVRNLIFAAIGAAIVLSACSAKEEQADHQAASAAQGEGVKLLNVSYDVSRDFFKAYNPLFIQEFKKQNPDIHVSIQQSHGGSSKQALSVANGLAADVVTMNQTSDIDTLQQHGLIATDWAKRLPDNAIPFSSVTVFLVRKGNPKQIKDWHDLARNNVSVVFANPKTSGNGRYAFLGAYAYGLKVAHGDEAQAKAFVKQVVHNVPMFENGSRASSTSFTQRTIGDVLITLENEANFVSKKLAPNQFEIIYPSYTPEALSPVAVVDTVAEKKHSVALATAYLKYLWSKPAQELAAQMYYRPSDQAVLAAHQADFPNIETFRPNETLGTWPQIMKKFFADGGIFDQVNTKNQ